MTFSHDLLTAFGAVEPAPADDVPSWAGWPVLAAAAVTGWLLWRSLRRIHIPPVSPQCRNRIRLAALEQQRRTR